MKSQKLLLALSLGIYLAACGSTTETKTEVKEETKKEEPRLSELALKGEQIYQTNCMQCHLMSKDALIGPGMVGVTKRVPSKDWAKKFIKNSQEVIKSGDKYAVALFEKHNKAIMTSFNFSDEEFESLWKYLEEEGK